MNVKSTYQMCIIMKYIETFKDYQDQLMIYLWFNIYIHKKSYLH